MTDSPTRKRAKRKSTESVELRRQRRRYRTRFLLATHNMARSRAAAARAANQREDAILALVESGLSYGDIGESIHTSRQYVFQMAGMARLRRDTAAQTAEEA